MYLSLSRHFFCVYKTLEQRALVSQAGMLAPDGRCKTLDNAADGYVRSEACGVLLLRSAPDMARNHLDQPGVLLRACSVNQDGRSSSLTAPNGPSQQVCGADIYIAVFSAIKVLGLVHMVTNK